MSAGELIAELAIQAEGRGLLTAMEHHYDQLKSDAEAFEHYRADVAAWDATVGDGLELSG